MIKFDNTCEEVVSKLGLSHMLPQEQLKFVDGVQITKERDNQLEVDVRIAPNMVHRFSLTVKGWFRVGLSPDHPVKSNNSKPPPTKANKRIPPATDRKTT